MKVKKNELVKIIKEELFRQIKEIVEADKVSADDDKKVGKSIKPDGETKDVPKDLPKDMNKGDKTPPKPKEQEIEKEPADKEIEKDVDDKEADAKSKVGDEITGKTIQSVTMEPDSKILPGAQEIVLTFNEITDPLKILLTKSGKVAFYFRGLHNTI